MNVMLRLSAAALLLVAAGTLTNSVLAAPGNGNGPPNGFPGQGSGPSGNQGNGPSGNQGNGPSGNQGNGPNAGGSAVNTVPEPSTLILSLAALGILARVVGKKRPKD